MNTNIIEDVQIVCSLEPCYRMTLFDDRIELFPLWRPAQGFYSIDLSTVLPGDKLPRYYDQSFTGEQWVALHEMRAA